MSLVKFNKSISVMMLLILLLGVFSLDVSYAETVKENQDKLKSINKNIDAVKKKLNEGKKKEKALSNTVAQLKGEIQKTENEIAAIEEEIQKTKVKIELTQKKLEEAQQNVDDQDENLSKRFRNMYKNGFIGFVDIVLGSNNVEDMVSNVDMVQKIYDNDKEVLRELKLRHEMIAEKKKELGNLKASLDKKQSENESKKVALNQKKEAVAKEEAKIAAENKGLFSHIEQLSRESASLEAEINRATSNLSQDYPNVVFVGGGNYQWPLNGYTRISSPFGYRIHPIAGIRRLHTGIDIPCPKGTPVRASKDGVVIRARYSGGYGKLVVIAHGNGIATAYAHNSSFAVSAGQQVKRGQIIAYAGSTGNSTGPHVHFEVRVNGRPTNPLRYVSK